MTFLGQQSLIQTLYRIYLNLNKTNYQYSFLHVNTNLYAPAFPLTKLNTHHKNYIMRVNIWDTAKNTILSHRYYSKLNITTLFFSLSIMEDAILSFWKLPPNWYTSIPYKCMLYIYQVVFLRKPDLDKINGFEFISEKRPMTSRKSTILNMLGCLCQSKSAVLQLHRRTAENEIHKIKTNHI